ncbi:MAG: SDR family oxidoreductase [Bacteroidales bacterium]
MKILLTGATGYIGKRLLPVLVSRGYTVVCCVRDKTRFSPPEPLKKSIEVVEVDFLDEKTLENIPSDIEGAYYLMHSMSTTSDYEKLELTTARNFRKTMSQTQVKHVVYLSGMTNEDTLSKHLASRKAVEEELGRGKYHFTTLRAGIIIGSGSASFEIIRDLVEKLPVMIAPRWLNTRCQPISVKDVITFLDKTLLEEKCYNRNFDIGGPDVLTYKEMLMEFARVRGLKRRIGIVPVMTPKLSSYWLYFITSTSYRLASSLVNSMKVEVVARDDEINHILNVTPVDYQTALRRTFSAIETNEVVSSWKDSLVSGRINQSLSAFIHVPSNGCFVDQRVRNIHNRQHTLDAIWRIGGQTGWYYASWLWKIRGMLDKFSGGVGLRRGRTRPDRIDPGDSIDFWRVLYASRKEGRLLLFAEMKLPGEAWLEFKIVNDKLYQTATFRPKGLWGRIYWYSVVPFHHLIFRGMIDQLVK